MDVSYVTDSGGRLYSETGHRISLWAKIPHFHSLRNWPLSHKSHVLFMPFRFTFLVERPVLALVASGWPGCIMQVKAGVVAQPDFRW